MPEFEIETWEIVLAVSGALLLLLVVPLLIPVVTGGITGRMLPGVSAAEGLATGFRLSLVGLLMTAALYGAFHFLDFDLPWSANFHGWGDAWRITVLPNIWLSLLCAVFVFFRLWSRRSGKTARKPGPRP